MTLSERLTVGLSHLSVFPKSQCPSGPLGNTAVAQSLLYSEEQVQKSHPFSHPGHRARGGGAEARTPGPQGCCQPGRPLCLPPRAGVSTHLSPSRWGRIPPVPAHL